MTPKTNHALPHQRLVAYQVAIQLFLAVREARISDAPLREQAGRAARSVCLNIAEAAGRSSRADQNRVFNIARGEVVEVAAAVEMAGLCSAIDADLDATIQTLCGRVYALRTALVRR